MKKIIPLLLACTSVSIGSLSAQTTIFTDNFLGPSQDLNANLDASRQGGSIGFLTMTDSHSSASNFRTQLGNGGANNLFLSNNNADATAVWATYDHDFATDTGVGQDITFSFDIGASNAGTIIAFRFGGDATSAQAGGIGIDSSLSFDFGGTGWSFTSGATSLSGNTSTALASGEAVRVTIEDSSTVTISLAGETIVSSQTIAGFTSGSNYVTFTKTFNDGNFGPVRLENFEVSVSSIPEPTTYALIFGLAGLCLAAYRRR